jgi:hypothetical protein
MPFMWRILYAERSAFFDAKALAELIWAPVLLCFSDLFGLVDSQLLAMIDVDRDVDADPPCLEKTLPQEKPSRHCVISLPSG